MKITDTSKVAGILGDLATANVSNVSGPDYVVGDPTAVQAEARGQAIQRAQADAKTLAGSARRKSWKDRKFSLTAQAAMSSADVQGRSHVRWHGSCRAISAGRE